jgi:aryl-phospho-beta-D-glucosidase BglC (GH1 family)
MMKYLLVLLALIASPALAKPTMFGVNMSGCEAGGKDVGVLCPTVADVDWYAAAGFTIMRFPVVDATQNARIEPAIDRALAMGVEVVVDRHTFRWEAPDAQLAYWKRWRKYFANPHVRFGLVNEPQGFNDPVETNDFMQWAKETKTLLPMLRRAGISNTINVEWPQWTATFRFDKGEKPTAACVSAACALDRIGGLGDANVLYEGHFYFNPGSSGTDASCAGGYPVQFRQALAKRGLRGFIGESAFGNHAGFSSACQKYGTDMASDLKAHPETYEAVTWWGGGRVWPASYIFAIAPKGYADMGNSYLQMLMGKSPVLLFDLTSSQ